MDWPTVSRYLNAAGLALEDPRRVYLKMLFKRKDGITEALGKRKGGQQEVWSIVQGVLCTWRRSVGAERAKEVEHMLGLTLEERGIKEK